MPRDHGPAAQRVERGIYRRVVNEKEEFGTRADDVTGKTVWTWGFPTLPKARQAYQTRRAAVRQMRDTAGQVRPTKATVEDLIAEFLPTVAHLDAAREQVEQALVSYECAWCPRLRDLDHWELLHGVKECPDHA